VNDPGPVRFTVRAPATSGNIGAGFDCLALTLDLWNTTTVELSGEGISVRLTGEFTDHIPTDETNLIVHTLLRRLRELGVPRPRGLQITCVNAIPPASGLGSSSSAQALGLMAADAIAGRVLAGEDLLQRLAVIEGHADNAAAVALGGLILVAGGSDDYIWRSFDVPKLMAVVVTPPAHYSTSQARALLPQAVPLSDAVFNMGRVPLTIEALRAGNLDMLREVMADKLHQRYRLALTAGAEEALAAAWETGAAGAFVSGSGPSLLAFVRDRDEAERIGQAMLEEFKVYEVEAAMRVVTTSNEAAGLVEGSVAAS
jgi:homoserine kinase